MVDNLFPLTINSTYLELSLGIVRIYWVFCSILNEYELFGVRFSELIKKNNDDKKIKDKIDLGIFWK